MLHATNLFYFVFLHFIIATPQINLHYTDRVSESESDNTLQHNCLHIAASIKEAHVTRQIISYCMSESQSKFNIEKNDFLPKFTFAELSKGNITSQQLYLWSAPIDLVERYQVYLNELSLSTEVFYNCTMPRFGPMCQYEFQYYRPDHSSLYEIIHDFYHTYEYKPIDLTCYTHLQCNRGPFPACLDWTEICDGQVNCLDGEFDEEHCWQLEINECNDNEYRCTDGQCIPQTFSQDDTNVPDCLDGSDEYLSTDDNRIPCDTDEPSFGCEDIKCEGKTLFTSSCTQQRNNLLMEAMYTSKDSSISNDCWSAVKCILEIPHLEKFSCDKLCTKSGCTKIIQNTCPDMFFFPNVPLLFGHFYFAYKKTDFKSLYVMGFRLPLRRPYVCYTNSRYDHFFNQGSSTISFNNQTCFHNNELQSLIDPSLSSITQFQISLVRLYKELIRYNLNMNYTSEICNRSNMYRCVRSSKCISIYRLMNNVDDCPHKDDEKVNNTDLMKPSVKNYSISFQNICDGYIDLASVTIDGQNETDETKCEQWPCMNMYTRCDGSWACPKGVDEIGCYLFPKLNCSSDHHLCVSPDTNQLMCLPIEKANDSKVDCIGGTDEPTLCKVEIPSLFNSGFHCMDESLRSCVQSSELCNGHTDCGNGDDEEFCHTLCLTPDSTCPPTDSAFISDVKTFLYHYTKFKEGPRVKYFLLDGMSKLDENLGILVENTTFSSSSVVDMSDQYEPRCHRGLALRVWLNNKTNLTTSTCLCPPNFYGDTCQYQNQRVSLVLQFRALSDSWQTLFAIVISLIDDSNERIIHSYEQFTYLSARDCKMKFNIYLLYSTRPKDSTKHYAIHIDIYEKVSLAYRGSLLFPVTFPFLPVHRLALIVNIPRSDDNVQSCSNHQCIHGKCIRYSNNPSNVTFCQCNQGWSGRYCTIQHTCQCSIDSLCIGVSANNRSICACPIHRFGSRCLIVNSVCQTNDNSTCQNNGQCIPADEYMVLKQVFTCICPKGFSGDRCEIADKKIMVTFVKDIVLSQSVFIHFIEVINNDLPIRLTTFKTISVIQDSIIIYWSQPFHLAFIELFNKNYYLVVTQKIYNQSTTIVKIVNPSDRCRHINEVLNETVVKMDLLRRIKYYQLPCQTYSPDLSCFYDDVHLCLCYDHDQQRLANCFKFDHNMTFDCLGQSECENGGQCFPDAIGCPRRSMCVCAPCFYGTRCQFSTSGFGLSLDAILGYHILPHINIIHQPRIVQISMAFAMIFIVIGLINGILSMITFKNKSVREVGCGFYLLGSSMTTLLVMIMLGLKFGILILAQMALIENRFFLYFQCRSFDFILRICLDMDQWLNACVAMERAATVMQGAGFSKKKSKQVAKLAIVILLIMTIVTNIHDPIYRRLIDEENDDEKRIWCIITYPSSVQTYNSFIYIFHFFVPFICNLISAVILITKKSHQQSNVQTHRTYKQHLRKQFQEHKHLIIAPIVLVILAIPRLIISFASKCMKSANDSWLFLTGYFISFIPPMLTFFIFIMPSTFYKKEFLKSIVRYRTNIRRRLYIIS